jgi:autotransporter translocation and assembly factor TamB
MAEQEFKDNNAADRPEQLNAGAPPAGNSPAQPASATTPPKKKKSRLLLKIAGGAVVLIILLVLAAPTLLSTGPVVSIALGQVNNQLNGHVEVNSVSLGWFSGVKVDGVRVFDAGKSQIAQLDHLVVPLPLWKAAMGNLSLGDVVCDGLSCDAKFDDQHRLNFAQLVKPSTPSSATPPATPAPAGESKPSKLPNISGNIKLTNCQVTVSQPNQPTVFLGKINGEFKIPDINQPISDTLALTIRAGDGPEGSVNVSGTAAAIKANQVAVDSADIHQTVEVNDLDLQTAKPFIPASEGVDTLAGVLGIHVAVDLTGGKNAQVDAAITGKKQIAVGGKVLNGDTFSTDTFTVAVPKLTAVFPSGLNQWQTARVQVGSAAG